MELNISHQGKRQKYARSKNKIHTKVQTKPFQALVLVWAPLVTFSLLDKTIDTV